MENPMIEHESEDHHLMDFITGLLLGGLAGAVAILLLAPQSGEKTRAKILSKSMELRNQTVETVEDVMTQARTKARQISTDVRDNVAELKQRGQEVLADQKEHLSAVVDSGDAVVRGFLD